jgi:membrane-associated HD superfamily phosphohydrolase
MAGGGDGKEQNYWPGFVDALSNVVLTLVFVLVVFVFALMITSGKVNQKAQQAAEEKAAQSRASGKVEAELKQELQDAQQAKEKVAGQLAVAKQELQKAQQDMQDVKKQLDQVKADQEAKELAVTPSVILQRAETKSDSNVTPDRDRPPATVASTNVIVIKFPRNVIQLNDRAKADLAKVLEAHKGQITGTKAVLDGFVGLETYSEGRRLAYYRAMDIRNFLIEKGAASKNSVEINTKVANGKDEGDARVEIRFVR